MDLSRRSIVLTGAAAYLASPRRTAAAPTPERPLRLIANENPYGPAESARVAMQSALADGWMYDLEDARALQAAIAAKEGVPPDHVIVTEGSGELLKIAGLAYGSNRQEVVAAKPTFTQLTDFAERTGGVLKWVPVNADLGLDLEAMAAQVTAKTGIVYVCNPNNPTGTALDPAALRRFIDALPDSTVVMVDEAYVDLADDPASQSMVDRVKAGKNVIVARTFSKIHGMAGLRVGYGVGRPDIIKTLEGYRTSIVNRLGLKAALASYDDAEFLAHSRKMVRACVDFTAKAITEWGRRCIPSQTNFVFFDTGGPSLNFFQAMRQKNILVMMGQAPYSNWARVSMGFLEEMEIFAEAARPYFRKGT